MSSAQQAIELQPISNDDEDIEEIHIPEKIIKEYKELNDKVNKTINRIKQRHQTNLSKTTI